MNATMEIEEVVADARNREEIALHYARLIVEDSWGVPIKWPEVNQAILNRYTISGLEYIKEKAWKIAEGRP